MDSPEYKTLTQCYPNLFTCVKQSPNHVVVQLRPSGILAPDILAFLDNPSNNNDDKAKKIIDSVMYQVQINPKIFYTFVLALKASGRWTETVVRDLEHTHTSLSAPTDLQTHTLLPVDSDNTSTPGNTSEAVQVPPLTESDTVGQIHSMTEPTARSNEEFEINRRRRIYDENQPSRKRRKLDDDDQPIPFDPSAQNQPSLSLPPTTQPTGCSVSSVSEHDHEEAMPSPKHCTSEMRVTAVATPPTDGHSPTDTTTPEHDAPQAESSDTAFVCPYCGECTMEQFFSDEGCPKQVSADKDKRVLFPHLDTTGLDEANRINLEYRLKSETKKIKLHFAKFITKIVRSLEALQIHLESIKLSILNLEAFTDDIGVKVLDEEDAQKIEAARNLSKIFISLRKYISFFNYNIIEHIIDEHGAASEHDLLADYLKKFHSFCRRSIFQVPQDLFPSSSRKTAKVFAFKCTEGVATVGGVEGVKGEIAEIFCLQPATLQLCSIKKGCVELHFLISAAVADRIFPVSPSQHSALSKIGVRILSCEGVDQTSREEDKPQEGVHSAENRSDVTLSKDDDKETEDGSKKSSIKHIIQIRSSVFITSTSLKTEDETALSPSSEAADPEQTAFHYLDSLTKEERIALEERLKDKTSASEAADPEQTAFHYLDFLTKEERIALEERLKKDKTLEIKSHFTRLKLGVIRSLEHSDVSLDKFKDFLVKSFAQALDKEDKERIEAAKTFSEVFIILDNYSSFINYGFIKRIIDHFGTGSDHDKLEDYLKAFEVFCQRSVFEVPIDALESSTRAKANWLRVICKDVATMKDVVSIRNSIANIIQIPTEALQLCSIKGDGEYVDLSFLIPAAAVVHASQHSEIGVEVLS